MLRDYKILMNIVREEVTSSVPSSIIFEKVSSIDFRYS